MANNNKQTIAGLLILMAVVVALVVILRPADDESNPPISADNTASETPPSKVTPATVDSPVHTPAEKPPEPVDLGLSTAEMFAGLFKAIDVKESRAAGRLLKALRASKEEDVIPTAKKHFVTTSREPRPSKHIAQNYQYYMLAIFADTDPEYALENVRYDWGKDGLDPKITTEWDRFDWRNIDWLASAMLKGKNESTADGLASLIVTDSIRGHDRYSVVLKWMIENYLEGMKETELPDPWLSGLISRIGLYWGRYSEDHKITLQLFLRWVVDAEEFSERLRAQAAALLQADPNSFWELLDLLATAESVTAVGKALAGLLSKRALTTEEQRIFVEAFHKRFSSDVTAYATLMRVLISASRSKVPLESIRAFAGASVTNALATDSDGLSGAYIQILHSIANAWWVNSASRSMGEILTLNGEVDIEDIMKLIDKAKKVRADDGLLAANFVWITDRSISDKISDAMAMLEKYEDLDILAHTTKALETWAGDLYITDGESVVRLLDGSIASSPQFEEFVDLTNRSNYMPLYCSIYLRQIGVALAATGFPVLSDSLKDSIAALIRAYRYDIEAGGEKDEFTEPHIGVLVDKYDFSGD
ncbi:MAG: hypothetical protein V3V10_01915 [Planctomycetota bacterium]